jgi:putative ABC transport system permease protein
MKSLTKIFDHLVRSANKRFHLVEQNVLKGEILKMAWRALSANKLRSALTASGMMVGVFSVISVMTALTAMEHSISDGLTFLGADTFQISKYPNGFVSQGDPRYKNRPDITYEQFLGFKRLMQDKAEQVCPKMNINGCKAIFENKKTNPNVSVIGSNEGFVSVNHFQIQVGRNLSEQDVEYARDVCVIGQQIVRRLFLRVQAVGQKIRINNQQYTVIGVFEYTGGAFGATDDMMVAIPITRFIQNYGSKTQSLRIAIKARDRLVYERTMGWAMGVFREIRKLRPEDSSNFELYSNDTLAMAFTTMAETIKAGAFVVSTIALIAAGISIMNIMLVSVTERTKEIGIRKSIGAKRQQILLQFLLESIFLSLWGAVSGVLLGIMVGNAIAVAVHAKAIFPWAWAVIGILFCSLVGMVFGIYPAHKASLLDPIEALRHE